MSHASLHPFRQRSGAQIGAPIQQVPALLLAALLVGACAPETGPPASPPKVETAPAAKEADSLASTAKPASPWQALEDDGLHDPTNPALEFLQQPSEALSVLPPAKDGNHVDWVAALRQEVIAPRTNIYPETKIKVLDLDILMPQTAGMPMVLFPHKAHTEWLDCENCHDKIFKPKQGANPVDMFSILQGEYCGQCHGAVSFPLTQCYRCHSVPRDSASMQSGG